MREIAPRDALGSTTRVIGSIAGDSVGDYAEIARAMDACEGLDLIELNVSCPNVHSGTEFGADPGALRDRLWRPSKTRRRASSLIVKLSPILTWVTPIRSWIWRGPRSMLAPERSRCATPSPAMGIDVRTREPVLANVRPAGSLGPALHPIVVRLDASRV